ncbi:hypothetical protein BDZ91DRAFT_730572 [Kalaharituber pfeilii]|nr:hypothetical protein BDZ91DRAFT_730572 [Kalaharituber pfeilii]
MMRPKSKDTFPESAELPISPSPPLNSLQDFIHKRYGGQPPPEGFHYSQVKRPSHHNSGAETDPDLPARKRTRSPPKTPTQGSPGMTRRANTGLNTPTSNHNRQSNVNNSGGGELVGSGLLGAGRGRPSGHASDGTKKEEDDYPIGKRGSALSGGNGGNTSDLSFLSSVTSEQWRQMRTGGNLLDADGGGNESDNEDGGQLSQQQILQRAHQARLRLQPPFGFGKGEGGMGSRPSTGQQRGGLELATGGILGLGRQIPPSDASVDFTDDYTVTDADSYAGDFDSGRDLQDRGNDHYNPDQDARYDDAQSEGRQPLPNTVYRPSSPEGEDDDGFYAPSTSSTDTLTISDILALEYNPENTSRRFNFFRQCSQDDWAAFGEIILEKQQNLAREMMKARAERAKTVKEFEDELLAAEARVDENMAKAQQYMARMKTSFDLLKAG